MSKLELLRTMTTVVADTGDIDAIARYQPEDATTNPSLLLKTAEAEQFAPLVTDAMKEARTAGVHDSELVTEVADRFGVIVGSRILELVPGVVSTEVDARLSFDRDATIEKARRLMGLYADRGIGPDRVLIKIASTWEGIQAAGVLEKEGIRCNLTLLFSEVQALAAARVGAFLISPFVGRILDWHKAKHPDVEYSSDNDPGVASVRGIYAMYKTHGFDTVVMGASFRNPGQVEALAGCDRLTISPSLLEALAADDGPLPRRLDPAAPGEAPDCDYRNESDFRFQLNADAMATEKLAEGIRAFCADQIKLEHLLTERVSNAA